MTLLLIYLGIALSVSFLCSVLEAVLLSSTHSYIEAISQDKQGRAIERLKRLKANIDQPIASILILNTFAHTMGAAGVGAQAQILWGEEWQTLIAFILTLIILYVSEIIPKTIGALYWKQLLLPASTLIHFMILLTYPLVWVSTRITSFLSSDQSPQNDVTRDEIMAVLALGQKGGHIESKESALIVNLFKLKQIRTRDIMTPRSVIFALPRTMTIDEALKESQMYTYSRIPLYSENLDDITGMVFNQKILEASVEEHDAKALSTIELEVHRVSENLPVWALFDLFVKRKSHLFVVFDQYGQTSGVVTLEDAIETLLGVEIVDEMDTVEDMQQLARQKSQRIQERMLKERRKIETLTTKRS
ncbi:MAG: transporter [Sulfurovum sp. PC08-66]|nr:MAG: transporter [Sulfurovum sp. PC08-66]KIM12686.1 MAG: transporter [Sulfuricurvum sp. PC08-66]